MNGWHRFVPGQTDGWWIALAAALALTTGTAIGWALLRPRSVVSTVTLPPVTAAPVVPQGAVLPAYLPAHAAVFPVPPTTGSARVRPAIITTVPAARTRVPARSVPPVSSPPPAGYVTAAPPATVSPVPRPPAPTTPPASPTATLSPPRSVPPPSTPPATQAPPPASTAPPPPSTRPATIPATPATPPPPPATGSHNVTPGATRT